MQRREAEEEWEEVKLEKRKSRLKRLLDQEREMQNIVLIYGLEEAKIENIFLHPYCTLHPLHP